VTSLALDISLPNPFALPPCPAAPDRVGRFASTLADLGRRLAREQPAVATRPASAALSQLQRIAAGDTAALSQVYRSHHRAVRACALRLLGDEAAAEDVVHDAFVSLPRAAARFRGECSVRSFIVSVALNHARHHLRAAKRRREAGERLCTEPTSMVRDPEASAAQRELALALTRALDRLPESQRVAFVLCDVEQRDSTEAAKLIGVPDATVRTRLHHARRKLRALIAKRGIMAAHGATAPRVASP